ncbi:hypothetical protein M0802_000762 [Mischocyttarus mexicanus]|nr:hypothetical protein M0802_000762 [Mischocyttarus mexicanus]
MTRRDKSTTSNATRKVNCDSYTEASHEEEVKDVRGDDDDDEDEEKVIGKDANSFKSISCVATSSFLKMKNVWSLKSIVCKTASIVLSALLKQTFLDNFLFEK